MNWLDLALKVLGLVLGALGTYFIPKLTAAQTNAANSKSAAEKAAAAGLRLLGFVVQIAPTAWSKMDDWARRAFADGHVDPAERQEAIDTLVALVPTLLSKDNLDQLASDLGVPLSGVVAQIASNLVERWAAAHDATNQTVSAIAYPIPVAQSVVPADQGLGG
jgi:hypothetical protein